MAEVSAKRQGQLIRGLLTILAKQPDGMPARDALAQLAIDMPPTPYEAADWPKWPGVRRSRAAPYAAPFDFSRAL